MRIALPDATARELTAGRALRITRADVLRWTALAAIVALAGGLRFANLEALGYVNHYYTAAVQSMLQSWHNFFFAAAEPGGSVSVDKPPVGLWLQVVSAYFLGVNTLGVLLPQLVAGMLSVVVVYHLVRRSFGAGAGLLAALALAVTPVVVATDRNNTMDSTLVFTLLLAAWTFLKATESGRLRYLLLGACLVGVGFNIKMLQAYLPLPAFFALYFLGAPQRLPRKITHLALAAVVLLAVSLSWAVAVDLTPADQRPYVGSSGDNSEISLITGYNGLSRLLGMGRGGQGGNQPQAPGGRSGTLPPGTSPNGGVPRDGTQPQSPGSAPNGGFPQGWPGTDGARQQDGRGGGGFPGTGQVGALRLFTAPLGKEASWLLPFGLCGLALLALYPPPRVRERGRVGWGPRWPVAPEHGAAVLWGGWLLTSLAFFSVAGFFHEYYLSIFAPPLAALVGIGAALLWRLRAARPWLAMGLLLGAAVATLALQVTTAAAYVSPLWWLPFVLLLTAAGAILLVVAQRPALALFGHAGFAFVIAALLVTPAIWSGLTTLYSSANQSLPAAYAGRGESTGPANAGRSQVTQALLDYLQANTQGMTYLMAVPSSMQGADYVIATGRPVLYLGGFSGQDQVETAASLAQLVANGELRFIYWGGAAAAAGPGQGGQSDVSAWVARSCTRVAGFDAQTRNAGAPDGTATGAATPPGQRTGLPGVMGTQMQIALYYCVGC